MDEQEEKAYGLAKGALAGVEVGPESKAKGVPNDGSAEKGDDFTRTMPTESEIEKALLKLQPKQLADIIIELMSFMEITAQNIQSVFDAVSSRLDFTKEESKNNDASPDTQPEGN